MRNSFVFYESWWEAIKNLPREIQGEVLTAIIEYGLTGETTESLKPVTKALLTLVKPQIEANNQKFENGKRGGRKAKAEPDSGQTETGKEPNANQEETKAKPNVNQTQTKHEPKPNQTGTYNVICNNEECNNDIIPPKPPKGREAKKNEPNPPEYVSPEYAETFATWIEYKRDRRESYKSAKSLHAAYDKLLQLSDNDPQKAASIVQQSMANNWAGLFELKTERNGTNRNSYPSKQEANDYALHALQERMEQRRSGLQDELPKPF